MRFKVFVFRVFLSSLLWLLSGTAQAVETANEYARTKEANSAFRRADKNHDNNLDGDEVGKYNALDKNEDQVISKEEFLTNFTFPCSEIKADAKRNVVYKKVGSELLLLDIYYPEKKKYDKAPVFYYTHGGGWAAGSKNINRSVETFFELFLEQGVVCVSVDYRLVKIRSNGEEISIMRDCVVDSRDGLRFLKKNEDGLGLDMGKVVVYGMSAGSHIAQLLAWSGPDDFQGEPDLAEYKVKPLAGVSWFGPADFREKDLFVPREGIKPYGAPDYWSKRVCYQQGDFYEDMTDRTRKLVEEVSPLFWAKKDSAPLLHFHGD